MILARISVKQPIFTTMIMAALIVFGIIAYTKIPILFFPRIDFPYVTITVVLPGASPETVESKITEVLEETVSTIEGVKNLQSFSMENVSQVVIEFELEVDSDVATQDVRDRVANARQNLPADIDPPLIQKFNIGALPILKIAVSSGRPIREITEFINDKVKSRFERIPGVGQVTIVGGRERQIRIWVDADKLRGYKLTGDDVVRTLQLGNIEIPGGTLESADEELVVKTQGEVQKVDDFSKLIISSINGNPIRVGDVSSVEDGEAEARTFSRLNGEPAVGILITRRSDANEIKVADQVYEVIDELNKMYKNEVNMIVAQDLTTFTRDAIADIKTTLLWGGLFATLVILFFLRNLSATLIAGLAIPISIISTFTFMLALGFTLNIITMLGLALSVGVLIDDAIVVIENIFRHREEGEGRHDAAINATSEIGLAVMAATFAILAVFIPVAFMTGIVGQFFYEFGLTVSVAVAVSLFVSFTLTPMLSSRFLRRKRVQTTFDNKFETIFQKVETFYRKSLDWSLHHRWTVVVIATIMFLLVIMMSGMGLLKTEFQPEMERDEFAVNIETPLGSTIDQTNRKIREIETILKDIPYQSELFTTVGLGQGGREEANRGEIVIKLAAREERDLTLDELFIKARRMLSKVEGANITVSNVQMVGSSGFREVKLQFSISGTNLNQLAVTSQKVVDRLKQIKGMVDLDTSYRAGKPELELKIDRPKAADLGVNVFSIASMVNTLVGGKKVSTFEESGKQYDVWIRLEKTDRDQPSDFEKLMVRSITGNVIDLGNLVNYVRGSGPSQINRLNRERQIEIYANLEGMVLGTAIDIAQKETQQIIAGTDMEFKLGGEAEIMIESFKTLTFTLMLAIILVYMILASQFNSFIHPITIMISLPLSIIGAFLLLLIAGKTFNMMSFIGIILLMGIVTKNSILLIDLTNQYREKGMERKEAILKAGPIRLRPILMTAFSTILGAVPVALEWGKGAEMRSPMAIVVIGGLFTSTLLTLLVIPVVYSILDDIRGWRLFKWMSGLVRTDTPIQKGK